MWKILKFYREGNLLGKLAHLNMEAEKSHSRLSPTQKTRKTRKANGMAQPNPKASEPRKFMV